MNIKQLFANFMLIALIMFSSPAYVLARVNTFLVPPGVKYAVGDTTALEGSGAGKTNSRLSAIEENLRQRAETEIQRRVTSLTGLITKLDSLKHIPSTQKTTFITNIQTEIGSLNTLLTKIQSDNDAATLRSDVKSVVTSFRVYALYMPQIRLLAGADSLLDVSVNLSSLSARLQERIASAQTQGQNVSSLQKTLSDMQTKTTDAQSLENAMVSEVTPLTPDGYPGNKTTLMDARSKFQTAILDLKSAAQDARQIIQGLISMQPTISPASPSSSSATPLSPTP